MYVTIFAWSVSHGHFSALQSIALLANENNANESSVPTIMFLIGLGDIVFTIGFFFRVILKELDLLYIKMWSNNAKNAKCCYGYIRVSTTGQAADGVSLDAQKRAIEDWAMRNQAKLMKIEVDAGVSGTLKAAERPTLAKLLSQLSKGDVIVTYTLSRFSRNFPDAMNTIEVIHERGAYFASVKEGYDTSSMTGEMTFRIMASVADIQAQQISEYSKEAVEGFKLSGRHNGRPPYGWQKKSPDAGSGLVEIPEEQKVIGYIRFLRSRKDERDLPTSYLSIANQLTEMEIPTPGSAKKWNSSTVKAIHDRVNVNTKGRHESN